MKKEKIVHLTFSKYGGAGRAAWRSHEAMLAYGLDSYFITRDEDSGTSDSRHIGLGSGKPLTLFERVSAKARHIIYQRDDWNEKKQLYKDYVDLVPRLSCETATLPFGHVNDIVANPYFKEAEIVVLHWVANMFDYTELMRHLKHKKVVWTLHDMNPLKGLFHYQHDEEVNGDLVKNVDSKVKNIKRRSLQQLKHVKIVSPSKWLAEEAGLSEITRSFPVYHIPYSLNLETFRLRQDRQELKEKFGYKADDVVMLFIAESLANYRKGFDLLESALRGLEHLNNVKFIAIGSKPEHLVETERIKFIPKVNDDSKLVMYYNLADCFVVPSREDNLPNVILESLACGCPVIGFNTGGIGDHILNFNTGILAGEMTGAGLAQALISFVEHNRLFNRESIREYAAQNFSTTRQAEAYCAVFDGFKPQGAINLFEGSYKKVNYAVTKALQRIGAGSLHRI